MIRVLTLDATVEAPGHLLLMLKCPFSDHTKINVSPNVRVSKTLSLKSPSGPLSGLKLQSSSSHRDSFNTSSSAIGEIYKENA